MFYANIKTDAGLTHAHYFKDRFYIEDIMHAPKIVLERPSIKNFPVVYQGRQTNDCFGRYKRV